MDMNQTAVSDFAPPVRRDAAQHRARPRPTLRSIGQWILAVLHAHARRQVALALGERVDAFNEAIRIGAETRRHLEAQKENQQ